MGLPSNDWRALADKGYTHLILRAGKDRAATVEADNRYDSAAVGPHGWILSAAFNAEGQQTVLVVGVALGMAFAI
jgi:apolipoprotein N-acyltransferase